MIETALTAFVTLFVIIDPVGLAPIFVALTQGIPETERRKIAIRACFVGFFVLALFGLAGERLLELVGIGMPAFRIGGGLLLFLTAVDMLFERRTERREKNVDAANDDSTHVDPSVFPLATPLIAGPGALATMILLVNQQPDIAGKAMIFAVMTSVVGTAMLFFLLAGLMERVIGPIGINVITRLLGMLLAALSVQFVIDGLRGVGFLAG
ncbi:MarC family protein [Algicella marina]|uniref:UPF0056 membrane protein n=1 Tax=Algicella marina TaxID=2683284 RepID=A0A6P1SZW7_9RHOB|nr:MarC family protein [Algicella marina]QHQ34913.1 NAAT family transporter [Algicella marina]